MVFAITFHRPCQQNWLFCGYDQEGKPRLQVSHERKSLRSGAQNKSFKLQKSTEQQFVQVLKPLARVHDDQTTRKCPAKAFKEDSRERIDLISTMGTSAKDSREIREFDRTTTQVSFSKALEQCESKRRTANGN
jgi:hypothetical protein